MDWLIGVEENQEQQPPAVEETDKHEVSVKS